MANHPLTPPLTVSLGQCLALDVLTRHIFLVATFLALRALLSLTAFAMVFHAAIKLRTPTALRALLSLAPAAILQALDPALLVPVVWLLALLVLTRHVFL